MEIPDTIVEDPMLFGESGGDIDWIDPPDGDAECCLSESSNRVEVVLVDVDREWECDCASWQETKDVALDLRGGEGAKREGDMECEYFDRSGDE